MRSVSPFEWFLDDILESFRVVDESFLKETRTTRTDRLTDDR
jgi:hypothetical protein